VTVSLSGQRVRRRRVWRSEREEGGIERVNGWIACEDGGDDAIGFVGSMVIETDGCDLETNLG
jgi:hypothetical protein